MKQALTFLTLAIALGILGCDSSTPTQHPAEVPTGIKANCLPCGDHELDVTDKTPFTDHNGQRYYFCSDTCKEDFVKDPATYIAKDAARKSATKPATNPT